MLFELLQGEVVRGGWQDEHVKRALDLCLSCKACKSECPTNVDIATYRAEFLSHYYEGRRRPLHAYAFGMVDRWLRLAALAPGLSNALVGAPGVRHLVQRALHLAPQRSLPRLAPTSFRQWARGRGVGMVGRSIGGGRRPAAARPRVMLWVDTFNNYLRPETSQAALSVLEAAGCDVVLAARQLCCGRPLYDFGLLDRAKQYLRSIMDELGEQIDAGIPLIVLEPSCASVFRDELRNLFPTDARATRLRTQTLLLPEFLQSQVPGYQPPRLDGKVLLHGHCHQKAIMKLGDEESLLRKMGVEVQSLDSGCCGMAGAFGFEADKYTVSQAVGERVLLPAVRAAAAGTMIVSDGFSCREQIQHATGRRAMHVAEVVQMAITR
jgi:Fe-S oxidoreductase